VANKESYGSAVSVATVRLGKVTGRIIEQMKVREQLNNGYTASGRHMNFTKRKERYLNSILSLCLMLNLPYLILFHNFV
jgi:hypothetical protein